MLVTFYNDPEYQRTNCWWSVRRYPLTALVNRRFVRMVPGWL